MVSALLTLLLVAPLLPNSALGISITVGKYDKWALTSQFFHCHAGACQGCMRINFPDILNPFDDGGNENCEGIRKDANFYYWMLPLLFNGDWVSFLLPTQKSVLEETVDYCRQFKWQENCVGTVGNLTGSVPGAYLIGSEFDVGQLDREFIDRSRTGPGYPSGADFYNFIEYCYEVNYQVATGGTAYWHYATHAAAVYLSDAVMAQLGYPTKRRNLDVRDVLLAKKLFIHSFVAQQCWELGAWGYQDEEYVLDDAGIRAIPFIQSETPSFYYEIRAAIDHIFPVSVTASSSSWGAMKSTYGEGN